MSRRRVAVGSEQTWRWMGHAMVNGSRALAVTGAGSLALAGACLCLHLFDGRTLEGASVWLKPFKFGLSGAVMALTFAAVLSALSARRLAPRWLGRVMSVCLAAELALITLQALRGVPSHFNYQTPFDAGVFQLMALFIVVLFMSMVGLLGLALWHHFEDPLLGFGLRSGLLIMVLGAGLAFAMPSQVTPAQHAALRAGQPTLIGGHAVGPVADSERVPLVGWAIRAGDLRVPHFVGLHAVQVIPLFTLWLRRQSRGSTTNTRARRALYAFVLAYAGLFTVTLAQALNGLPPWRPSPTLYVVGTCLVLCLGYVAFALHRDATCERTCSSRPEPLP